MIIRKLLIVIILFFKIYSTYSQEKNLKQIDHITISNGLAHNGVTSVLEDSRGFLWIGTYEGLNKYDGYDLTTYKNTVDKEFLVSNRVRSLSEDYQNNIWIGTDKGITLYNYNTEKFKKLFPYNLNDKKIKKPIVRKIIINKESDYVVCVTQSSGILLFDKSQDFIGQFKLNKQTFKNKVSFFNGISLDKENYLLSTSKGAIIFNCKTKTFKRVLKDDILFSKSIVKVAKESLIVTLEKGLAFVDFTANNGVYSFNLRFKDFKQKEFNSALIDASNSLWLGTLNNGIIHINNVTSYKNREPFVTKTFKKEVGFLRSSCLVAVTNKICWFGTFNDGLFKFNIFENPFKNYKVGLKNGFQAQATNVSFISSYNKDQVFLTAKLGGLALYDTKKEQFLPLPFNLSIEDIRNTSSVFVDSNENIWIKITKKGFFRIKNGAKKATPVLINNISGFKNSEARSFTEDAFGNIWIGCVNDVFKVSVDDNNEITNVESLNKNPFFKKNNLYLVRVAYADALHNFLWLGADSDGLFRVKIDKNTPIENLNVTQYKHNQIEEFSISSDFVTSIIRLPNEDLWVGTEGGGINKVFSSETDPKFSSFTEKNGLSNNAVKSILYDDENNLWIATNIGLNRFDTKELRFRRFGVSDGLPFEDFWFVSEKIKNGKFLFSGLDGLCYFNPEDLPNDEPLPRLEFGNLKVFNKPILSRNAVKNRVLDSKNLKDQGVLNLKYNENIFSIDLISLHFLNPDNHNLKYRLLPLSKEWIEISSKQKTIQYTGLQPGEYTLQVLASNALDKWTAPKVLKIIISPPFWKTSIAYFLYFLMIALITYAIIYYILKVQKLKHNVQIEKMEKNNVKEINAAKFRFFSNISHELKTPLTLITGPVGILADRFKNDQDVTEKLQIIKRQSKKITHLVNQTHDFQKAEVNALKLNYSRFNFNTFIEDLIIDFQFMAENDGKKLEVNSISKNIIVSADKDKLEKIFNNILSNSFKYTKPEDTIRLEFKSDEKDLTVVIKDTGKGIDKIDLEHVFERFYQSHNNQNVHKAGSGIGLAFTKRLVEMHYGYISADSELDIGTTMKVRLPIVKKLTEKDTHLIKEVILSAEKVFKFEKQLEYQDDLSQIEVDDSLAKTLVFVVEDNLEMRLFVSKALSKFFIVKSFRNGQECLNAMEDEWPDIVVSDVQMPEMNGLDLCKLIKSDIKTSHIPVILLTALVDIEDKIQGIRDGADAYIRKPFNMKHLIARIEFLLENRKQLRERFQIGIPLTKENNVNNRNDNAFLEKLYNLIEENLDNQNLDLNSFTKELYLNRTHFYQKVKALTNLTPFEVLKDYRLKKAADFLVQKNLSVNEVYIMTGFKSRTHFSKLFKEKYSITPGKYATTMKEKYNL
ncbi:response regulator [Polaribacter sp.]|nr:response regulator [Polaribacter sp.]